jgi:hypothetical protein
MMMDIEQEYQRWCKESGWFETQHSWEAFQGGAIAGQKAMQERSAEEFAQFAIAIRHQCRGRVGDLIAQMAMDRAEAIRAALGE